MSGYDNVFIDEFSVGLDELAPNSQKSVCKVLQLMVDAGRFSVFEATDNDVIATTVQKIIDDGLIERSPDSKYPWTYVTLTEAGRLVLEDVA